MYKPFIKVSLTIMAVITVAAVVISIIDPFNTDAPWINWLTLSACGIAGTFLGTIFVVLTVQHYLEESAKATTSFDFDRLGTFEGSYFSGLGGYSLLLCIADVFGFAIASSTPSEFNSLVYTSGVVVLLSFGLNGMISYLVSDSVPRGSMLMGLRRVA